jgi:hypothetical protein
VEGASSSHRANCFHFRGISHLIRPFCTLPTRLGPSRTLQAIEAAVSRATMILCFARIAAAAVTGAF